MILTLDFMYWFDIEQITCSIWHSLSFNTESHLAKLPSITSFATHWSPSMECVLSSWFLIFNLKMCFTIFLIDSYFELWCPSKECIIHFWSLLVNQHDKYFYWVHQLKALESEIHEWVTILSCIKYFWSNGKKFS